mgnify:CR=1 FL=1
MKNSNPSKSIYADLSRKLRSLNPRSGILFEWLADHRTDLEKTGHDEAELFMLIDEYIRLLEVFEAGQGRKRGSDARLLKEKEREIRKLVNRKRDTSLPKI